MSKKTHWQKVFEQLWPKTYRVAADVAFIRTFRQAFFGSTAMVALINIIVQPANFSTVDWGFVGVSIAGAAIAALIAAGTAWQDVTTNGPSAAYQPQATATVTVEASEVESEPIALFATDTKKK